jgi:hypothetical protein
MISKFVYSTKNIFFFEIRQSLPYFLFLDGNLTFQSPAFIGLYVCKFIYTLIKYADKIHALSKFNLF